MYIKKPPTHGSKSIGDDAFFNSGLLLIKIEIIVSRGGLIMEIITAVHRNHFGKVINFVTSEGRVISYRKALMDAENGLLHGVQAIQEVDGTSSLLPETDQTFEHYPTVF
jgi:hypothetical protein